PCIQSYADGGSAGRAEPRDKRPMPLCGGALSRPGESLWVLPLTSLSLSSRRSRSRRWGPRRLGVTKVAVVVVSVAALVLASVGTAMGVSLLPAGYSVADREAVYPGIDYQKIVQPARPVLGPVRHSHSGS